MNLGTPIIHDGVYFGFVAMTHDSWTEDSGFIQPDVDHVHIVYALPVESSFIMGSVEVLISSLNFPNFQVQAQ